MFYMTVLPGEDADTFASRAKTPLCMLLRANGLLSRAWIIPGREMIVPDKCGAYDFPCPVMLFGARIPAMEGYILKGTESPKRIADEKRLPERIVLHAMSEANACGIIHLPVREENMRVYSCGIRDTWKMLKHEADTRLFNRCFGNMYPGMKILIYGDEEI